MDAARGRDGQIRDHCAAIGSALAGVLETLRPALAALDLEPRLDNEVLNTAPEHSGPIRSASDTTCGTGGRD